MREKIVLIGAGSATFTRGLVADLIRSDAEAELRLVDVDPEALEIATRLSAKMITARRAPITLSASEDRREVLQGATAVICTIAVGGRRASERDASIPRHYGIFMPVCDTVGPGGASRALRMIPAMVDIARDVVDLAPEALFFNYGNPMAPVCRGVRKATGAHLIGLCHGVDHVARYLANALGVAPSVLQHTAIGINHLTWFVSISVNGQDAFPQLHRIADTRSVPMVADGKLPSTHAISSEPSLDNPFSWSLLKLFGAFPAVLDRHVTEFFPQFFREGHYYGRTLGLDAFNLEAVISKGDQIYAEMREAAFSPEPLGIDYFERLSGEHEKVLDIIHSIRHGLGRVFSANLPNTGQVPNLPPEAIVEGPAIADHSGLRAIPQPPLSPALTGTLASRYMWVETVIEAALEGSREKFIQALVLDGAVSSIEHVTALADDLLVAQAPYLPWTPEKIVT